MRLPRFTLLALAMLAQCGAPAADAAEAAAPARPNILILMADDLGYSDLGCYGSEITTPNLDRLAADGLRFTQFYNTARCWPTRAALMSGYYPQQVRMDPAQGRLPAWAPLLPNRLKPLGYRSYHSGKWHIGAAPRPVADGGFDRSYVLDDHDRNFYPRDHREDDRALPPVGRNSGYYSTTTFADHAIRCLKEHAGKYPSQPFLSYVAFTVPHFPLQAPAEDVARYRDRYADGWEVVRAQRYQRQLDSGLLDCALSAVEREVGPPYDFPDQLRQLGPREVNRPRPWETLSPEQRRFQSGKMAVHAAMVDRMDREIGRILDQVRAMGAWDNTAVFFLSDNGASAEIMVRGDGHHTNAAPGSAGSYLCLGPGWSSVANTPLRRHKTWVHEGGISTPLVVHWPKGIAARGEFRRDIGHVIDLVPTALELAGAGTNMPAGAPPFPGRSLVPAFARDGAVAREEIFFLHEGNRALRMGSYKLVSAKIDNNAWQLYDLSKDRGEQHDLAAQEPGRVKAMAARWQELREQYQRDAAPARKNQP